MKRRISATGFMAIAAGLMGFDGLGSPGRMPSYRPKTPPVPRDDAAHLAAAEEKRRRKAEKKNRNVTNSTDEP